MGMFAWTAPDDSIWSSEWQPLFRFLGGPLNDGAPLASNGFMDPGVGALVGAAAFMGGTSRIALTITVMMVEITGDPMMIAPVGVATLAAVVTGNWLNHGLYHQLIDVASFSFMPDRWPKHMPKALRIGHILEPDAELICVPLAARKAQIETALEGNTYSSFPVVNKEGAVVGLAMRTHLQMLIDEDALARNHGRHDDRCSFGDAVDIVDVGKVTDFHFLTIRETLPLEAAFTLYKRMEGAHMVVVDVNHRPLAVITRASLLPWNVEARIGQDRIHNVRPTIERPSFLRRDDVSERRPEATFSSFNEHV